ncbi:MAG TPA: DUF167 domain-containing protein [Pyrinomonadaceae bacterium]
MSEQTVQCTEHDGAIVFKVRVVPRARQSGIAGVHDGALRVRVAAPPVDGAANEELARTLARALGVPRRAVEITSGHASRLKQVRVQGVDYAQLESLAHAK